MAELTRLLLAAQEGDRACLAAWVRQTQGEVWRLCAHLVDVQAADDLAQETYLRAVTALPAYRGQASARTWLLAIARRVCADAIRSRQRRRRLLPRLAPGPPDPDPAGQVAAADLLSCLKADRREAFVLTQQLGLSYAEAAAVCGCPVGTIRSRVARARADLLDLLDRADHRADSR